MTEKEKEIKGEETIKKGEAEMGKEEKKTAATVENDEEMTFTPVSESSKEVKEDEETETIPDEDVEIIEEDEETTFTAVGDEEEEKENTNDVADNICNIAKDVIDNFKRVLSSDGLDKKMKDKAKEKNIPEEKLKGTFIRNIGRTISNLLNLGLDFVGSTIKSLFGLLNSVVRNIVDYASIAIRKLIAFLTLTPMI